jgi:hypothetical protein
MSDQPLDRLTLADVEGVKLVTDLNNFVSIPDARTALEIAFTQGSQGWGVRDDLATFNTLARELRAALALAEVADEAQRMNKGAQLALGKAKKRIEVLEAEAIAAGIERAEMLAHAVAQERSIAVLKEQLEDAYAERTQEVEPGTVIESHPELDNE